MWTRADLKAKAKEDLKRSYWGLVLAAFIFQLLSGGSGGSGGNRNAHKRTLFKKVSVVYIKGLPRIAYIDKFTGENQWVAGICFLFLGFMCLWALHQGQ